MTDDNEDYNYEEMAILKLMQAYDMGYQDACDEMAEHLATRQRIQPDDNTPLPVDEVILGDEETLESD